MVQAIKLELGPNTRTEQFESFRNVVQVVIEKQSGARYESCQIQGFTEWGLGIVIVFKCRGNCSAEQVKNMQSDLYVALVRVHLNSNPFTVCMRVP